jgi:hypothetical protein
LTVSGPTTTGGGKAKMGPKPAVGCWRRCAERFRSTIEQVVRP